MNRLIFAAACSLALLFLFFSNEKNESLPVSEPRSERTSQAPSRSELRSDSLPSPFDSVASAPKIEPIGPKIYFTVDDGPSEFSAIIARTAKKCDAPITVFLIGKHVWGRERAEAVKAYRSEPLIEMANHSFCHARNDYDRWYLDPSAVVQDFEKNEAFFELRNKIARLPGRAIWAVGDRWRCSLPTGGSAAKLLKKRGFRVFGWDVEWHFERKHGWPSESAEAVFSRLQKRAAEGAVFRDGHVVLLLHERHFQKPEEVERLISMLKSAGWAFEMLKNYPS